jgi:hypothetical protein
MQSLALDHIAFAQEFLACHVDERRASKLFLVLLRIRGDLQVVKCRDIPDLARWKQC